MDLSGSRNIPMSKWTSNLQDVLEENGMKSAHDPENRSDTQTDSNHSCDQILVVCRRGNDSQVVANMLKQSGISQVKDVIGGLNAWSEDVDPEMPKY